MAAVGAPARTDRGVSLDAYGALLDSLRGLRWPSHRRSTGALPGVHESRRRGASPELSEYRAYRQGDDTRQLDWKLLARTDRAFVRLAEERAIVGTMFVVDASASMDFPTATSAKWRTACALTVGLSAVAHAAGDPVGLTIPTDHGAVRLAPRTRRGTLEALVRALASVTPGGSPPLDDAVTRAASAQRIVIVSDLLGDEPRWRSAAHAAVGAGRDVIAVHVVAREELEPQGFGLVTDPEDGGLQRALTRDQVDGYRARYRAWRDDVARGWRQIGASFVMVDTTEDVALAVRRVVGA